MNSPNKSNPESQIGHSYWTLNRGDNERAFRAARRHSRIVRGLRILLPAIVVITAAGVTLRTYLDPLLNKLPVRLDKVVVSGSNITMVKPRMSGFTRDGRAYDLTADAAVQNLKKPGTMKLQRIHAKFQMQNNSTVHMTATKGLYDTKADTLKLDDGIFLSSTDGYKGHLSSATIDIRKGHVVSNHPVRLELLQGTLDANRMEITDAGDRILFTQGVKMTMMLNKNDITKTAPDKSDDATKATSTSPGKGDVAKLTTAASTTRPASVQKQANFVQTHLPPADQKRHLHQIKKPATAKMLAIPMPPRDPRKSAKFIKKPTTHARSYRQNHRVNQPLELSPASP